MYLVSGFLSSILDRRCLISLLKAIDFGNFNLSFRMLLNVWYSDSPQNGYSFVSKIYIMTPILNSVTTKDTNFKIT